ncbi:acyl-CoA synthetase [Rhodococcus baikonurensis]
MVGLNSKSVLGPIRRVVATAQNGLEVVRLGGLETDATTSPFEIVERAAMYRLRRYFPDSDPETVGAPIVLIPPMMMSANVYDVTRDQGAVGILHEMGLDPWVVDFGSPDSEEGGWDRNLADHIIALSDIIDHIHRHTGKDVHISGYSQGGMFAYQAAAYRRSRNIASVITFGSPVDTLAALPFGIPAGLATKGADFLADHVFNRLAVTGWMARTGFQLLDPVKTLKMRVDFLLQLHDREALLPREQQRRFLATEGWVAWSGPAVAELLKQFIVHNRMMTGGFVIKDQLVSLAEITCPILAFVGEVDDIGQPQAVRGISQAAPRAKVYESTLRAGHFGLVVGSTAANHTWPTTGEFVQWTETGGPLPDRIANMVYGADLEDQTGVSISNRIIHTVASVAEVGAGVTKGISDLAAGALRGTFELSGEAARALPRLARLNQIQPHTKISLSQLLAEQRRKAPNGECFLFDNRVHTYEAVNARIDNVVRGLISVGVRPAAHVGVLMETRPSALAAIAALSRLGAVAVMLPPGSDISAAVKLGSVDRIITDPENVDAAVVTGRPVLVLGGGDARGLEVDPSHDVIDLEQIDPTKVNLPGGTDRIPVSPVNSPSSSLRNPAAFSKPSRSPTTGGHCRPSARPRRQISIVATPCTALHRSIIRRVCSRPSVARWPVGHGSRSRGLNPARFVEEIHRYGVTVVSYTWSMMREILDEDLLLIDGSHPVRLFIGSGMPHGLWKRTTEAFDPRRCSKFYASTEGDVILANVAGSKVGSKGRPLPGSAQVRLAAYDPLSGRLLENGNGFVRECADDEVGLLLGRAGFTADLSGGAMRGLFQAGDSWIPTENLFRRDGDGDYWLIDHKNTVISTLRGPVFTQPIVDALSSVARVDLAVAYGVGDAPHQLAVAAVTWRPGRQFRSAELAEALSRIAFDARPDIVHVVDEIPVGSSYRPSSTALAAAGLPAPGPRTWFLDSETQSYKRLTKAIAAQLMPTRVGTGAR